MLLATLASSLGSASAQTRAALTARPLQPVQIVQTLPIKPVMPPIQALPTHPSRTPAGCTWVYLNSWHLMCGGKVSLNATLANALRDRS
ncbi:hypothetical protein [Deinococcus alpinitundrae]|uniref:hypothetical protein n=1 Tax=Deinococcus alpinitundrae TaxID=468913 RepID=UPI00137B26BB|nr:hypothetical protein [Deinococcus alpinitundrae]